VLADAAGEGALGVLCLGDLVGYGADPVACVETVGERASAMVAGNHEHAALGLMDLRWFNPWARAAARWTGEQLDGGQVAEHVDEGERGVAAQDQHERAGPEHADGGPDEPVVEWGLPGQVAQLERLAEKRLARVVDRHDRRQSEPEDHVETDVAAEQREKDARTRPFGCRSIGR